MAIRKNNLIDIVIVNWNSGVQLAQCISSVVASKNSEHLQIYVVDNGSTDESLHLIETHPRIEYIKAGINLGFGKACNIGANLGSSELILFLNPDATLNYTTLERALAFMKSRQNIQTGICGVQLLDEDSRVAKSCSRFPTPVRLAIHASGLDRFWHLVGTRMAEWPHDHTREVDQVIGAFFMVRRKVFQELCGFDERFFMYYEEVDFSRRAQNSGWRTVYFANAQAFHAGGGTSHQIKARRLFYSLRSRLLYAFKHFGLLGAWLVLLTTLFLEPFTRSAYALMRGSWTSIKETWSGYTMLWSWLPQWVLKGVTR